RNEGIVRKTGGIGASKLGQGTSLYGLIFQNAGIVEVETGTVSTRSLPRVRFHNRPLSNELVQAAQSAANIERNVGLSRDALKERAVIRHRQWVERQRFEDARELRRGLGRHERRALSSGEIARVTERQAWAHFHAARAGLIERQRPDRSVRSV